MIDIIIEEYGPRTLCHENCTNESHLYYDGFLPPNFPVPAIPYEIIPLIHYKTSECYGIDIVDNSTLEHEGFSRIVYSTEESRR